MKTLTMSFAPSSFLPSFELYATLNRKEYFAGWQAWNKNGNGKRETKDYQYNANLDVGHNVLSKDTKCLTELCGFKDLAEVHTPWELCIWHHYCSIESRQELHQKHAGGCKAHIHNKPLLLPQNQSKNGASIPECILWCCNRWPTAKWYSPDHNFVFLFLLFKVLQWQGR